MSKTKQILELSSPSIKTLREHVVGMVQRCHYCCGSGWFWGTDEFGESEKLPCPLCGGAGQLRPEVTIEWKGVNHV
ncbi:hypothetical protein C7Y71_008685 [Pseudoprevotella muciniphila]|uniref:Uncharacterized protein n=1 Tax=Pseudoprevotella muciniphila TaxID=2133944 RepID=A0A5P8E808_9BACT|nr:hypothetical protein [Pseudoprevotella muciniphila]QFQ13086.1 hypothetical protein C7Y71_008685 [Pseudoprevotella muciniphila]